MLKKLFGSGARVKLLRQFFNNPNEEFFIRELTRILEEQINSLRRELENLESIGILKSREKNRRKYYSINPHCPILDELGSIVKKTNEDNNVILKELNKLGNIDLCVLSGSFVGIETDIDLFLVGDVDTKDIEALIADKFPETKPSYGYMTKDDFLYRITLNDNFVKKLFKQKKNIILKNKMKKDTVDLIQA